MKLRDIYKHKTDKNIIQIDSFATSMNRLGEGYIIIYTNIENGYGGYGSCPSFNGYGTKEEIEKEYEILVPQEELNKYETWEDIFNLIKVDNSLSVEEKLKQLNDLSNLLTKEEAEDLDKYIKEQRNKNISL